MSDPASSAPWPRPWSGMPLAGLRGLQGVLTDIDDTLTQDGAIAPLALQALARLRAAGLPVVAVTGRPAGWSGPYARRWPLAAIVAENGAVMLRPDPTAPEGLRLDFAQDPATRARNARRLQACAQALRAEVPAARQATDSPGRLTDLAIDHAEHHRLDADDVARVVAVMTAHGLTATVSSIHVNGWIGGHDKASGARWAVAEVTGRPLDPHRWIYVGDSANDQAMFRALPCTVGVANIAACLPRLSHRPAWITAAPRGEGFAEVADRLLRARATAGTASFPSTADGDGR